MAKYWIGDAPTECDLKGSFPGKHDVSKVFVDGRMQGGSWANMCPECHKSLGVGLGTGHGQEYTKQEDGKWLKTRG